MSGKYALIVGNTEYTDPGLAQLTAPSRDVIDFARVLSDREICAFDEVNKVLNESSSYVIEAIDEFFAQKKPDDLLVLYFSGHGVRDEFGSLYLAFKNTIRSRLRSTAIKSDYIREVMDQSRSKRQVLILDCCNSGAFPQGTKAEVGGVMGMMSALQGFGRFVLTASDATQFAWEGDKVIGETKNSLFTHFLVKGLQGEADNDGNGIITVDELYDYAYEQISRVTPKQTPTKSSSKQEGEIILRHFTREEDIKPVPLPSPLLDSIENPIADIRFGAVQHLSKLLNGKNLGLARSARAALEKIAETDDSQRVKATAKQALASVNFAEHIINQPIDNEKLSTITQENFKLPPATVQKINSGIAQQGSAQQRAEAIRAARERERLERQQSVKHSTPVTSEKKVKEKDLTQQSGTKTVLIVGSILAVFFLCTIGSYILWIFNSHPVTSNPPSLETATKEIATSTSLPVVIDTITPDVVPPPTDTASNQQTATPTTLAPPTSTPICNQAILINDVTVPDGSILAPGASFTKTWRLKNTGACTWTSSYGLRFDHGDQMGAPTTQSLTSTNVPPGVTVDISVNLIAPTNSGTFQGDFKLLAPDGTVFGTGSNGQGTFWVRIVISPTPTPTPTSQFDPFAGTWLNVDNTPSTTNVSYALTRIVISKQTQTAATLDGYACINGKESKLTSQPVSVNVTNEVLNWGPYILSSTSVKWSMTIKPSGVYLQVTVVEANKPPDVFQMRKWSIRDGTTIAFLCDTPVTKP